ncbi:unnamed protein product [Caenorhabditis sp. 36 PRJEB53466]|nr:unnamed protein product [Caenorhabditis sp. 36 PRJEB53466]
MTIYPAPHFSATLQVPEHSDEGPNTWLDRYLASLGVLSSPALALSAPTTSLTDFMQIPCSGTLPNVQYPQFPMPPIIPPQQEDPVAPTPNRAAIKTLEEKLIDHIVNSVSRAELDKLRNERMDMEMNFKRVLDNALERIKYLEDENQTTSEKMMKNFVATQCQMQKSIEQQKNEVKALKKRLEAIETNQTEMMKSVADQKSLKEELSVVKTQVDNVETRIAENREEMKHFEKIMIEIKENSEKRFATKIEVGVVKKVNFKLDEKVKKVENELTKGSDDIRTLRNQLCGATTEQKAVKDGLIKKIEDLRNSFHVRVHSLEKALPKVELAYSAELKKTQRRLANVECNQMKVAEKNKRMMEGYLKLAQIEEESCCIATSRAPVMQARVAKRKNDPDGMENGKHAKL